jgi:hypothetical protein
LVDDRSSDRANEPKFIIRNIDVEQHGGYQEKLAQRT